MPVSPPEHSGSSIVTQEMPNSISGVIDSYSTVIHELGALASRVTRAEQDIQRAAELMQKSAQAMADTAMSFSATAVEIKTNLTNMEHNSVLQYSQVSTRLDAQTKELQDLHDAKLVASGEKQVKSRWMDKFGYPLVLALVTTVIIALSTTYLKSNIANAAKEAVKEAAAQVLQEKLVK